MPQPALAPQQAQVLIRRSTNIVELRGLFDETTGAFPTTADVRLTLKDAAGANVPNAINLAMGYVANTTRFGTTYRATLAPTIDLSGATYTATITVTLLGAVRELNIPCSAIDG